MTSFVKWLARQKIVVGYTSSVINLPLLGYLTAAKLHDQLSAQGYAVPTLAILVALLAILWALGWLLFRSGLMQAEMEFACKVNPAWQALHDDVREAKEK